MGGGCGSGLVIQSHGALLREWAVDVVQDWRYRDMQLCYVNGRWMGVIQDRDNRWRRTTGRCSRLI